LLETEDEGSAIIRNARQCAPKSTA